MHVIVVRVRVCMCVCMCVHPLQDRVSRSSGKRIANMRVPGIISAIKRSKVSLPLPSFLLPLPPPVCVMEYVVYASTRFTNVFIIKDGRTLSLEM